MDNHPAPTCVKCGHERWYSERNADKGTCGGIAPSGRVCRCQCVFPAAPTDEVVAVEHHPTIEQLADDLASWLCPLSTRSEQSVKHVRDLLIEFAAEIKRSAIEP